MSDIITIADEAALADAVTAALAQNTTLDVVGRGSKRGLGRPSQTDRTLDVSGLSGVTLYEPEELILSAKAGTPMAGKAALRPDQNFRRSSSLVEARTVTAPLALAIAVTSSMR